VVGSPAVIEAGQAEFPPVAAAVPAVRRFVSRTLSEAGVTSLAEVAELAASEVATNAVLYAHTTLRVRVRASVSGPAARIEIADGSPVTPGRKLRGPDAGTGRGIALLDRLASRWGASPSGVGKVVWFELGEFPRTARSTCSLDEVPAAVAAPDPLTVRLLRLPPALVLSTIEHSDALLREAALMGLGAPRGDPTQRSDWLPPPLDLTELISVATDAATAGIDSLDSTVRVNADAADAAIARLAMTDEAETLIREGKLLVTPAAPEVGACRRWLCGQVALQAQGLDGLGWWGGSGPAVPAPHV
jgi:anti-sigma regulatory factor (Ser/Thr protein kinase)